MDADKVESSDDILAAADARLHAPVEPVTAKVTKGERREPLPAPQPEPERPSEEPEREEPTGAGQPESELADEPFLEVDGDRLTPAQVRQMKRDSARVADAEKAQRAARYLLENPQEYARIRREQGLETAPEPKPEPHRPAGPDPVDDPRGWKYDRFQLYVNYLSSKGQTAAPHEITQAVEADFREARAERVHEILLEERQERLQREKENEKRQAEWRQEQEVAQITRILNPLFKKYPEAASDQGQKDVEAHILRAVHLGEPVDYEGIVKMVHERSMGAVKEWTQRKRAIATGARAAAGGGGSAQGTRQKLVDRLPADISSITEGAERLSRGEQ